jgi:hypothetical protein
MNERRMRKSPAEKTVMQAIKAMGAVIWRFGFYAITSCAVPNKTGPL